MGTEKECCGTCQYHKKDHDTGEWYCNNKESDFYVLETNYRDWCENHEER